MSVRQSTFEKWVAEVDVEKKWLRSEKATGAAVTLIVCEITVLDGLFRGRKSANQKSRTATHFDVCVAKTAMQKNDSKFIPAMDYMNAFRLAIQEQRDRFTRAYLTAAKNEVYQPAMRSIQWSHAMFFCRKITKSLYTHNDATGYHNLLLFAMENLLRLIDCRVTIPYWDVSLEYGKVSISYPSLLK